MMVIPCTCLHTGFQLTLLSGLSSRHEFLFMKLDHVIMTQVVFCVIY